MKMKLSRSVNARIRKGIERYSLLLKEAHDRNIGESDTANIVNDMLADVFGYQKLFDITSEFGIRGRYADFVIRLKDAERVVVEVKSIGTGLKNEHVRQAVDYAATQGIDWVALTNGIEWRVYHMKFSKPVDWELVYTINLLDTSVHCSEKVKLAYLLSKESITDNEIDSYWQEKVALSPANIAAILLTDPIIKRFRAEVKVHTGYLLETDDLRDFLKTKLFRTSFRDIEPAHAKAGRRVKLETSKPTKKRIKSQEKEEKKAAQENPKVDLK